MADYTALVDTDGVTGDYASLSAAEAAEQSTGGSGDTMTITVQASTGAADTTAVVFVGWSVDLITIEQADFPSDGIFDSSAYRLQGGDIFTINQDPGVIDINGFQIHMNGSGFADTGLAIDAFNGTWTVDIDKLIVFGDAGGSNSHRGVYLGRCDASGSTITIKNSTIYGFDATAARGVAIDPWNGEPDAYTLINSTVYNCTTGVRIDDTGVVVKNCAVFNNGDDFAGDALGTETVDYNASDDGDGTNSVTITQSADDWAALVTDAAGGDFSVTDTSSELYNAGTNTGAPSDDLIGTSRPQATTVDIGAFELIVAAGGTITTSLDALLNKSGITKNVSLDALLNKSGITQNLTLDALVNATLTKTVTLDALIKKTLTEITTLDALINKTGVTQTTDLDALLNKSSIFKTTDLDALLQKLYIKTTTLDALINKADNIIDTTLDAVLFAGTTVTATLDALLNKSGLTRTTTLDALINKSGLIQALTLDALISKTNTITTTLDAVLILATTKTVTLDALLTAQGLTRSTTLDAVLILVGQIPITRYDFFSTVEKPTFVSQLEKPTFETTIEKPTFKVVL